MTTKEYLKKNLTVIISLLFIAGGWMLIFYYGNDSDTNLVDIGEHIKTWDFYFALLFSILMAYLILRPYIKKIP